MRFVVAAVVTLAIALVGMPAHAATPGVERVETINVRHLPPMPQAHVVHDVLRAATDGDVVLWQEIALPRYKAAVRALDPVLWGKAHLDTEDPITWRRSIFRSLGGGRRWLSGGVPHVTPTRWATWQVLQRRDTGVTRVYLNTHLVSGAWNGHHPYTQALRRRLWRQEWSRLASLTSRLASQYPVVGGGDYNRRQDFIRPLAPGFRWLTVTHPHGIDVLWRVGRAVRLADRIDTHFYSDHNARISRLI